MTNEAAYAAAQAGLVDVAETSASFTVAPIPGYNVTAFESVDHRELNMPVVPAGTKIWKPMAGR
jgi:peptide/nickel transport system substrate-binding protein